MVLNLHAGLRSPSCPQPQDSDKLERIQKRATEVINGLDGLIYEERLKGLIICIFVKEQLRRVQELLTKGSCTVNTLNTFH